MTLNITLNGKQISLKTDPLRRLLDILRVDLKMTSVKEGCGEGECGACSILLDGEIVNSCMIPAGTVNNSSIVTSEGLRETERGRVIIEAFAGEGAVQCGFCTPGMLIAAEWLLSKNPDPSDVEIREALSGNLCRCTGYDMIIDGVKTAAKRGAGLW